MLADYKDNIQLISDDQQHQKPIRQDQQRISQCPEQVIHKVQLPNLASIQKSAIDEKKPNPLLARVRFEKLLSQNARILGKRLDEKYSLTKIQKRQPANSRPVINSAYKHIKPKVMNHTQKLAPLPSLNKTYPIPELQSPTVLQNYKVISHVGKGGFSVVSAAVNKQNHHKYAIKTYSRIDQMQDFKLKSIQSEVQNLYNLSHENIIQLKHAVKDGRKIQLVMENGGQQSLSGLLRKNKFFDENIARKYFKQVANGIAHCHQKNICHRDLKLENILVDNQGNVKLIDFGFSTKCSQNMKLNIFCGTPPYMSPQIASRQPYNGMSADIWALGVALYLMLVGKFPFKANNEKQLYRLIQQGKYKAVDNLSKPAQQLLANMLKTTQNERATAKQVLQSEWINQQNQEPLPMKNKQLAKQIKYLLKNKSHIKYKNLPTLKAL